MNSTKEMLHHPMIDVTGLSADPRERDQIPAVKNNNVGLDLLSFPRGVHGTLGRRPHAASTPSGTARAKR